MTINITINALHVIIAVTGILGFCGSILLVVGNGDLEKANAFFNKLLFSVGPSIKKGNESILNIDNWLIKKSRLVGVVALIASLLIVVNLYAHVIR